MATPLSLVERISSACSSPSSSALLISTHVCSSPRVIWTRPMRRTTCSNRCSMDDAAERSSTDDNREEDADNANEDDDSADMVKHSCRETGLYTPKLAHFCGSHTVPHQAAQKCREPRSALT